MLSIGKRGIYVKPMSKKVYYKKISYLDRKAKLREVE